MPRSQSRTPEAGATPLTSAGSPQKRARTNRTAAEAKKEWQGGEWGEGVSERLRRLRGGMGVESFAAKVGTGKSQVSSYENGGRLPGASTLRKIAEATGVSLDWLVLGDGGDIPERRGELIPRRGELVTWPELVNQVGAYLHARIAEADAAGAFTDRDEADAMPTAWRVDAGAVLRDAAAAAVQGLREQLSAHAERVRQLRGMARLLATVRDGGGAADLPPDADAVLSHSLSQHAHRADAAKGLGHVRRPPKPGP